MVFFNNATNVSLYDSGMVPIAALNSMFTPSGPHFDAQETGGVLRIALSRRIDITPSVGPGTYQNTGTITITRN